MRRISSACGGIVSRRISSKKSLRGLEPRSIRSVTYAGVRRRKPGLRYHSPAVRIWSSRRSGSNVSGCGR